MCAKFFWEYNPSPWPEPICFHLAVYQCMYTVSLQSSVLLLGTVSEVFNGALSLVLYAPARLLSSAALEHVC